MIGMNYRIQMTVNDESFQTLADILPVDPKPLDILFIAKTPAPVSVEAGHYFQGKQGKMFWNKLQNHRILTVMAGTYEDENLLAHNYGITDIVKKPRNYGNEPTPEEYKDGLDHTLTIISSYTPKVLIFIYKAVLDNILKYAFSYPTKSHYGFNPHLASLFHSKVFVFPMPGTPCTREQAHRLMTELKIELR